MKNELFAEILASIQKMEAILAGAQQPARQTRLDPTVVRQIPDMTGLPQTKFAQLLHVDVATLRNWEQGRRTPTGPAQALRAVARDPVHVLRALA